MKALLIMIIRRLYTPYLLLAFLQQEDAVTQQLKVLLHEDGKFPARRTWERRLENLPARLPEMIGYLSRHLVGVLAAWAEGATAAAVDSTKLSTAGGVWRKKHKEKGEIPHTSTDCEAGWSKSGWHGWWYGWKLHLGVGVGSLWIPLAAG